MKKNLEDILWAKAVTDSDTDTDIKSRDNASDNFESSPDNGNGNVEQNPSSNNTETVPDPEVNFPCHNAIGSDDEDIILSASNRRRGFLFQTPPGVERISGTGTQQGPRDQRIPQSGQNRRTTQDEQLPQAYPVIQVFLQSQQRQRRQRRARSESPSSSESEREGNKDLLKYYSLILVAVVLIVIIQSCLYFNKSSSSPEFVAPESEYGDMLNDTITVTKEEGTEVLSTFPNASNTNDVHKSNSGNNMICYNDTLVIQLLEWEAYERGDDPSIPRTYHFCPNTVINIYEYDRRTNSFMSSEGVHPLVLFRSNINIICGFDGELHSNCTFANGLFHILIHRTPIFITSSLNSNTENITIQGFHFTNSSEGYNIISRSPRMSLTIRNCHFHNNNNMTASIQMTMAQTEYSETLVQNCIFESNTYTHNPNCYTDTARITELWKTAPNVGAILSFPMESDSAFVKIHVSNSIFFNNTFLLSSVDLVHTTGGIINLLPPVSTVEVTDTCFIENHGYSSGLILVGEREHEENFQDYYGNYFSGNTPNRFSELSCILMHQNITYKEHNIGTVAVDKYCVDYIDLQERRSNKTC